MNWNDLHCFLTVADAGSLTRAADAAGVSVATIARRMDSLEQAMGGQLMLRSRSGITLTPLGITLVEKAALARDAFDKLESFANESSRGAEAPPIRVSGTEPVIADFLAPRVAMLPDGLRVDLIANTSVADLYRLDADLAIRMFRPSQPGLVVRHLATIDFAWFASPGYVLRSKTGDIDLSRERLLVISPAHGDIPEVRWVRQHGLTEAVVLQSTSSRALLNAALGGAGIALGARRMGRVMGLMEVQAPVPQPREIWLASHPNTKRSGAIQQVKSWIADAFQPDQTSA